MEEILEVGVKLTFAFAGRLLGLAPGQAPVGLELVGLGPAPAIAWVCSPDLAGLGLARWAGDRWLGQFLLFALAQALEQMGRHGAIGADGDQLPEEGVGIGFGFNPVALLAGPFRPLARRRRRRQGLGQGAAQFLKALQAAGIKGHLSCSPGWCGWPHR